MSRFDQAATYVRQHGLQLLGEAAVNFAAPALVYSWAKPACGEVGALALSSAPPICWSVAEFIRRRRVDAVSMLVLAGIVLSLMAFLGGGGVKILQLREKLVTALIGLAFLGSVAIGRPLIYQLARAGLARKSPSGVAEFEALSGDGFFKRTMILMTLVWGVGLLAEAGLSAVLVFALPVATYLAVAPLVGYATMGGLGLWTVWYRARRRKMGKVLRAQAAQTSTS